MSTFSSDNGLHLPDLVIKRFRGIRELSVARLGRVTLIAGKNGVGKTTVLDAVNVFANRGIGYSIAEMLERRDELREYQDSDGDTVSTVDWSALFWSRHIDDGSRIVIGPAAKRRQLSLRVRYPDHDEERFFMGNSGHGPQRLLSAEHHSAIEPGHVISEVSPMTTRAVFRGASASDRRMFMRQDRELLMRPGQAPFSADAINCRIVGPGLMSNEQTRALWSSVALTDEENNAVDALNLVYGTTAPISRVAVVGGEDYSPTRAVARIAGADGPVPLKSLGDGAVRLFGIALSLASSRDGILLIDEVENGIHHSVQRDFWAMIIRAAHQNDVQVLATTHGWDAVVGFAQAVTEIPNSDGALVRLERDGEDIFAVEYSEDDLRVVAEEGIEVR